MLPVEPALAMLGLARLRLVSTAWAMLGLARAALLRRAAILVTAHRAPRIYCGVSPRSSRLIAYR